MRITFDQTGVTRICLVSLAVALSGAACSSGGGSHPPRSPAPRGHSTSASSAPKPLASHTLLQNPRVSIDLMSLERVSAKVVVARLRAVNNDSANFGFATTLSHISEPGEQGANDPNAISQVSVVDTANSQRYFPLVDAKGQCLCTLTPPGALWVGAGKTLELNAAFPAPPTSVNRLSLLFPEAQPFLDIPVGSKPGETFAVADGQPPADPAKAQTKPPREARVISEVDNASGSQQDNGPDLTVRISADVLFALNKSDLSPQAQSILADVAKEIDKSPGKSVKIDGYTDNSGDDSINNPLSNARAHSVQAALQKLVTRTDLAYQPVGHGAADPIAPNDNDQDKAKNRRVTITFAKPQDQQTAPSAAPSPAVSGGPLATLQIGPTTPSGYIEAWPHKTSVHVTGLHRYGDDYTQLTLNVHNDDPTPFDAMMAFSAGYGTGEGYRGDNMGGVKLVAGGSSYRVLRDDTGDAFGPVGDITLSTVFKVGQGRDLTVTLLYKVPLTVSSVNVSVPGFGTATQLTIS